MSLPWWIQAANCPSQQVPFLVSDCFLRAGVPSCSLSHHSKITKYRPLAFPAALWFSADKNEDLVLTGLDRGPLDC